MAYLAGNACSGLSEVKVYPAYCTREQRASICPDRRLGGEIKISVLYV
jgi:hypothetical protein